VPKWKRSPALDVLTRQECRDLLRVVDCNEPAGRRDLAILRLIVDLGLRCTEVAEFLLEDIDWHSGTLSIRKNKERRGRLLPLPPLVGKAIINYLRDGRPKSASRHLFLCHRLPVGQPITPGRVRGAVRRAMQRSGISRGGMHRLRHAFATRLHARGASLKEVADVLGHKHFDTTATYARVNLLQLAKVALPWPGVLP
jgi:integrase/recombinase XerD